MCRDSQGTGERPAGAAGGRATGNLDAETGTTVLELFTELSGPDKTIMMVTHERDVSAFVHRAITLADGRVADPGTTGEAR
ncbi:hypothetical protein [Streptomyces sp. CT34]|uniref:hypothetical protein n=1 Tax=Streptomyces sp. CT34 TaxID=1553907 RepID=UPI00068F3512|nr:hypothetical protein [Streptomyces sp. CT34]